MQTKGRVARTRPDWCLVAADWGRWRIARCGAHRDNHDLLNSDHLPLGVEVASVKQDIESVRRRRVCTGQPFDASKATEAQLAEWQTGLAAICVKPPTLQDFEMVRISA